MLWPVPHPLSTWVLAMGTSTLYTKFVLKIIFTSIFISARWQGYYQPLFGKISPRSSPEGRNEEEVRRNKRTKTGLERAADIEPKRRSAFSFCHGRRFIGIVDLQNTPAVNTAASWVLFSSLVFTMVTMLDNLMSFGRLNSFVCTRSAEETHFSTDTWYC